MQISLSLSLVAKIFLCWLEHTEKRSIHPVFHVLFFPSFPVHANQSTHTHTLSLSLSLSLSLLSLLQCWPVVSHWRKERGLRPGKVRVPAALLRLPPPLRDPLAEPRNPSCREGDDGRRCAGGGGVGWCAGSKLYMPLAVVCLSG